MLFSWNVHVLLCLQLFHLCVVFFLGRLWIGCLSLFHEKKAFSCSSYRLKWQKCTTDLTATFHIRSKIVFIRSRFFIERSGMDGGFKQYNTHTHSSNICIQLEAVVFKSKVCIILHRFNAITRSYPASILIHISTIAFIPTAMTTIDDNNRMLPKTWQ